MQDILNILRSRWPFAQVEVVPALVQGDSAAQTLVKALRTVDSEGVADVIIIGRGGGSIEDLWAFNDEVLARAIFDCKIPVVSSVGHETDFTICDFVADMRAPTPTAAAVIVTPDKIAELDTLAKQGQYLSVLIENILTARQNELSDFHKILTQTDPNAEFRKKQECFTELSRRMIFAGENLIEKEKSKNDNLKFRLFALNPTEILKRGYSVTTLDNKTITSASQVKSGDVLNIILSDGDIDATVN